MAEKELWFTALGPSGAGKTTLLACMHKRFEDILPGSFYPSDTKTFSTLNTAYKKLESEANNSNIEFEVGVEGTSDLRQYAFTVKGSKASLPVRFFDFPGGWLNPYDESQAENHEQVIKIVQRSMVIMVAINTPYIMEYDGRYKDLAGIEEIEHAIKMSLMNNDDDKLIILVPFKCERYTRTANDAKNMRKKVKEVFENTLKLSSNPIYKDRLAIALMPVHTVGNAHFSRFTIKDKKITQEVYVKNRSMKFSPKDSDQPLRYAMSFLLNEFAKGENNSLTDLFAKKDLPAMGEFIRSEMKTDDEDFEILCGRELITEQAEINTHINPIKPKQEPQPVSTETSTSQTSTQTEEAKLPKWFEPTWAALWVSMWLSLLLVLGVSTSLFGVILVLLWLWGHRKSKNLRILSAIAFFAAPFATYWTNPQFFNAVAMESPIDFMMFIIFPIVMSVWVGFNHVKKIKWGLGFVTAFILFVLGIFIWPAIQLLVVFEFLVAACFFYDAWSV